MWAHLDTSTGTQPSGCGVVSIAQCCSVNAAFLFAEPRMLLVVSKRTRLGFEVVPHPVNAAR